jgi:glutathione S-transferase
MFENPVLKLYALVSALVALHLILLAMWTGIVRTRRKTFVNPEDAAFNKGTHVETDHLDVLRVKRAHYNALENAVPFFAIGLAYALSRPSNTGAYAYFFTFLAARVLHSVVYLWGKQPLRTATWGLGVLATVGMGVHVIRTFL